MASEGPNSPSTVANDAAYGSVAWSNPGNAATSNDAYAEATGAAAPTNYLKATGFGFAIPSMATIDGIVVEAECKRSVDNVADERGRIVKGGTIGATNRGSDDLTWNATDTIHTYGGATDLWGETWTPADINASTFGVAIAASLSNPASVAHVDHLRITVYYTEPGPSIDSVTPSTFYWTQTAINIAGTTFGTSPETSLTLSGNEITDTTRAAGVEGDGRPPDSSFGIWPATTNLLTNGGFETNTTGWSAVGGTLSRSTEQAQLGSAALKHVSAGSGLAGTQSGAFVTGSPIPQGTTYTFSIWLYGTPDIVGLDATIQINESGGGSATVATVSVTTTVVAGWQRLIATGSIVQADRTSAYVIARVNYTAANQTAYWDGAQVEQHPIATPYVETDGATASRSAARVQMPVAGVLDETQFWGAFRVRHGWGNGTEPGGGSGLPRLLDWGSGLSRIIAFYDEANNRWQIRRTAGVDALGAVIADAIASGDIVTVVVAGTATQIKISADGSAFATAANTTIPDLSGVANADIGSEGATANWFNGDILWAAFGTGVLTDADAATIHAFGNDDPDISDLPGEPTALWTADDGNIRVGRVEIADSATYATATRVPQRTTSWSDTAIEIDAVQGALGGGQHWVFVTDNSANVSDGFAVTLKLESFPPVRHIRTNTLLRR